MRQNGWLHGFYEISQTSSFNETMLARYGVYGINGTIPHSDRIDRDFGEEFIADPNLSVSVTVDLYRDSMEFSHV